MSSVKELLRKLINEEIEKLEEQGLGKKSDPCPPGQARNVRQPGGYYWRCGPDEEAAEKQQKLAFKKALARKGAKEKATWRVDFKVKPGEDIASVAFAKCAGKGPRKYAKNRAKAINKKLEGGFIGYQCVSGLKSAAGTGSGAGPRKGERLAKKSTEIHKVGVGAKRKYEYCLKAGTKGKPHPNKCNEPGAWSGGKAYVGKCKYLCKKDGTVTGDDLYQGAAASKDVAKRKPRRKSMDILELQSLLKRRFGDKINLGTTGKNKDGVDGAYGTLTQRAIDLLRKTDKNAPKRQGSFKKSVRALVDYLKGAGKGTAAGKAKPQAAGKAKPQGAAKAPGLDLAKTIDSFSMKHGGGVFGKWIKAARKKGVSDEKIMNTIKGATANNTAWRAAYKNLKALSGRVDESKSPLKPLTMKDTMESFREHLNESEVEEAMPGVPTKVEREEYKRETAGSADFVDTGDLRNALGENFNDLQIVDPASYPDVMAFTNSTSNDKLLPLKRTEDGTIYFKINDYGGGSYMKIKI